MSAGRTLVALVQCSPLSTSAALHTSTSKSSCRGPICFDLRYGAKPGTVRAPVKNHGLQSAGTTYPIDKTA